MDSGGTTQQPFINSSQMTKDQVKANANSAITQQNLNQTNQVTPIGSLTYTPTGGTNDFYGNWIPSFTATTTLSPELEALRQKSAGVAGASLNWLNNRANSASPTSGAYEALMARARQELDRARSGEQTQLANRGIEAGSEAYHRALQHQDQALVDASNQATINASQLAGQDLQQNLSLFGTAGSAAMGVPNAGFVNTPGTQVAPTDTMAPELAAIQAQTNAANQANQYRQAGMGGLFGLGGAALGAAGSILGPWGTLGGSILGGVIQNAAKAKA